MCKMTKQGYKPYDQVMINPNVGIGALVDVAGATNGKLGGKFWEQTSCARKLRKQKVMGRNILPGKFRLLIICQRIEFPCYTFEI